MSVGAHHSSLVQRPGDDRAVREIDHAKLKYTDLAILFLALGDRKNCWKQFLPFCFRVAPLGALYSRCPPGAPNFAR